MKRRDFLGRASVGAAVLGFPAIVRSQTAAPRVVSGVQAGDVTGGRAVIWSRASQPGEMEVEWATNEKFENSTIVGNAFALKSTGLCAKADIQKLPAGETIFYRVRFRDLADSRAIGEPATGRFKTPPADGRDVTFIFGADTVGQGYGINASMGGLKIYDTMARVGADLFIHLGDTVYSDQPIEKEKKAGDGTIFRNLTTEAKSKVAETLDEFRGQWEYNLLDENFRRFNSQIAQFLLWDDHEVHDNWYPGQILDDPRFTVEKRIDVLASRARRGFFEFTPIRGVEPTTSKIDRVLPCGPLLDVFGLDMRSYRGPNGSNHEPRMDADFGDPGRGSTRDSQEVSEVVARGVEGHRFRHAHRPDRGRRTRALRGGGERRSGRSGGARAGDRRSPHLHQAGEDRQTSSGSPATCTTRRLIATLPRTLPSRISIRSGSSWPGRCTRARSVPTLWTGPSVLRSDSSRFPRA